MDFDFRSALSEDVRTRFYIGGRWREPSSVERLTLISPVTEEIMITPPAGQPADMAAALSAARSAFDSGPWPRLSQEERASYVRRIAEGLRKRHDLLRDLWIAQVGVPRSLAEPSVDLGAAYLDYYASLASTFPFEEERPTPRGSATVVREPVGVSALIVPWNSPLILLCMKLGAALMAGCTVIVKPSPEAPFDALILAEVAHSAGVPAGVLNIVPAGPAVGDWLIREPGVDKISFTGSTAAGKHIAAVAAERFARVGLELGGKSASIICDDADVAAWARDLVPFTIPFSGQICFSQTRILVPERRHNHVVDALASAVASMRVGDPWDPATDVGPLVSHRQRTRVLDYIEHGRASGARLVTGGGSVKDPNRGFYVEPTIFDRVCNKTRIAREEIFGPVLSVIPYRDDDHAVEIANDSDYGLSGSIFSQDLERAERMARRVRTGNITINGLQLEPSLPFGGFKQSGIGREGGREGVEGFTEVKSVYRPLAAS